MAQSLSARGKPLAGSTSFSANTKPEFFRKLFSSEKNQEGFLRKDIYAPTF
jgi:hypothetical protein